jgi:hypothetical protein
MRLYGGYYWFLWGFVCVATFLFFVLFSLEVVLVFVYGEGFELGLCLYDLKENRFFFVVLDKKGGFFFWNGRVVVARLEGVKGYYLLFD